MSLFGHLALKFGSQPENLATEALGYVLGKSARARRGFLASFHEGAPGIADDLRFETQHTTEDQGRPDLAGVDETGSLRLAATDDPQLAGELVAERRTLREELLALRQVDAGVVHLDAARRHRQR